MATTKPIKDEASKRGILFLCVVVISVYLISPVAQAQYFAGPISTALGGAGRAATEAEEGVFYNPAVLAHAKEFSTALYYGDGQQGEGLGQTDLALSFVDNTEGVFLPGSLSYVRRRKTFSGLPSVNEEYWQAALGTFGTRHLSVGLAVHFRSVDQQGAVDFSYWNATLGTLWAPSPNWGLAVVAHNLSAKEKATRAGYLEDLPEVGVGAVLLFERILKTRFDLVRALEENPDSKMRVSIGAETYPNEILALRLGFEKDDRLDQQFASVGFGFLGPRLKIDYALRKNTESGGGAMHSVDFRLPF
jgi:hypothetical protein